MKNFSLADLKIHSVQDRFVEREIQFNGFDEETKDVKQYSATVFIRVSTTKDNHAIQELLKKENDNLAVIISENVRLGDGNELIPLDVAKNINSSLAAAMLEQITMLNSFESKQGKA